MKNYLSLIKFSHTIFALPFALLGFVMGIESEGQFFSWQTLVLVVFCMVFARSAAMAFNRYLDRDIDAKNDRTAVREIPSGIISPSNALLFVILNCILFIVSTYFINSLCFYLSPVALIIVLGYSWTKRFTFLCHFVLGLGLALAPIGAYISVTSHFAFLPIIYGFVILFWVSGFDIIYSLQDESFDRSLNLHSVPVKFGRNKSMAISIGVHVICAILLLGASIYLPEHFAQLKYLHWVGAAIFIGLLFYQHLIISPKDLSRVNIAFFTTNGIASFLYASLAILDFYI